jgi:hypothetical protein
MFNHSWRNIVFVDIADSPSHPDRDTGKQLFDVPDMDADVLPIGGDGDPRPAPMTLPTTRPRIAPADSDAKSEVEHPEGPPLLMDDNSTEDLDPELDEQLLTQHKLTPAELLEGELVSEEMQRRGCQSTAVQSHLMNRIEYCLSDRAMNTIQAHNFKVNVDLGSRAYAKMRRAFPKLYNLPSLSHLQSEINFISGLKPERYDCCKDSCCCFIGVYADLDKCPYCEQPRYDSRGRPRATYLYLPLIPGLQVLFADKQMCEELLYCARFTSKSGKISDIFNSPHYRQLRGRHVHVEEEILSHLFFDQDTDIAMGLSTDGVCPFKNRKLTCWPLLGVLYNLKPELCFLLEHVICFGVIPGPCEPKDLDSFLIPLRNKFWRLARGVATYKSGSKTSRSESMFFHQFNCV